MALCKNDRSLDLPFPLRSAPSRPHRNDSVVAIGDPLPKLRFSGILLRAE